MVLKDGDFNNITEALTIASQHDHPSVDSIKQVFYQLVNGRGIREEIHSTHSLTTMPEATRGLAHYDQLMKGSGVN